jgi:hypothetical protein
MTKSHRPTNLTVPQPARNGSLYLFDIVADPTESVNLANSTGETKVLYALLLHYYSINLANSTGDTKVLYALLLH